MIHIYDFSVYYDETYNGDGRRGFPSKIYETCLILPHMLLALQVLQCKLKKNKLNLAHGLMCCILVLRDIQSVLINSDSY
jgi:hypothetical protein